MDALSISDRIKHMKAREQIRREDSFRKRRAFLERQKFEDTRFARLEKIAERVSESENPNGKLSTAAERAVMKKRVLKALAKGEPQDQP